MYISSDATTGPYCNFAGADPNNSDGVESQLLFLAYNDTRGYWLDYNPLTPVWGMVVEYSREYLFLPPTSFSFLSIYKSSIYSVLTLYLL